MLRNVNYFYLFIFYVTWQRAVITCNESNLAGNTVKPQVGTPVSTTLSPVLSTSLPDPAQLPDQKARQSSLKMICTLIELGGKINPLTVFCWAAWRLPVAADLEITDTSYASKVGVEGCISAPLFIRMYHFLTSLIQWVECSNDPILFVPSCMHEHIYLRKKKQFECSWPFQRSVIS